MIAAAPRRRLISAAALMILACPIASTLAQPRRLSAGDSVPRELVLALLRASPSFMMAGAQASDPDLLVGALPARVAGRLYVPPGARVIGSSSVADLMTGILSVPGSIDSVRAQFGRELGKAGWTARPAPGTAYMRGGGFRPAPTSSTGPDQTLALCREHELLFVGFLPGHDLGGVTVALQLYPQTVGASACNPQPIQVPQTGMFSFMPTLLNPPGTVDDYQCSTGFGGTSTGGRVRTNLSAEGLLDAYSRQLRDSGWASAGLVPNVTGRSWSKKDSTGAIIETTITVSTAAQDPSCRELNMQVRRRP